MNLFGKLRDFLTHPTHKRTLGIVIILVLAATVSLTVVLSQQQQTIRQRASGSTDDEIAQMKKSFPLCANDSNLTCLDNTTVDQDYPSKYKKCLSAPENANFNQADRINGKSLTRCIATRDENDNYRRTDAVSDCTLFSNYKIVHPTDVPSEICDAQQIQEDIKATADYYPSCWDGNDPPALDCEASAVNLPCSSEKTGYSKCLSTRRSDGADIITRKFLVCCKAKEYGLVNDKCTLVADGEYSDPQCKNRIPPILSINPNSINEKGDLNFSFTGFDPGEQVTVGVVGGGSLTVKAGSDSNGKSLIPGLTEPAGKYTLKATGGSSGQSATAEFEIIATPILNIDPAPITTGGNLKYSFSGFQQDEIIEVWVNKRDESGVDNRTGGIVNVSASDGGGTISGLTELAGKYTLSAKGVSSERFTTAEFDISSSAHVLPKLNPTSVPASKLALPPTSVPATDRAHDLSAFDSPPTITPFVEPCRFKNKGDANCDDKITIIDFNIWKEEFTGAKTTKTADFNEDNKISITDFNVWKGGFTDASLQH